MGHEYTQEESEKRITDLEVGDKFITNWRMVNGAAVDEWNILFGVTNPLFFSDEYAQEMGFKQRIVPGVFTYTFLFMTLLASTGLFRDGIFLGTDKCRYPIPVYAGDMLRAEIEILSKIPTSKGDRIVIRNKWLGRNQHQEVAAEVEMAELFRAP